jgi:hypothetical protein
VKKLTTALVLAGALVFGTAGSCQDPKPTEWNQVEFPDCDADDRKGKWDTADCGPSPRPMKTAYQPAPSKKPAVKTQAPPKPRTTRR